MAVSIVDDDFERSTRLKADSEGVLDVWQSAVFDPRVVLGIETPEAVILGRCAQTGRSAERIASDLRRLGFFLPIIALGGDGGADVLLRAGADAVLPGQSGWAEIRAQVEAVERRTAGLISERIRIGDLIFEPMDGTFHAAGGRRIALSDTPARVLKVLVERRGRLVSTHDIGRRVWGEIDAGQKVHFAICGIRKALDGSGLPGKEYLRYVRGLGYVLEEPAS